MKILIIAVIILFFNHSSVLAEDNAQPNKAYLKDGKIVVETQDGVNVLPSSQNRGYETSSSSRWIVQEKGIDPVQEALKVFKNKSTPLYRKRIWILDRGDDNYKTLLEIFGEDTVYPPLTFSPYDDFVYYLGLSRAGIKGMHGVNLLNHETFFVDHAQKFNLIECPDDVNYIVVLQDGEVNQNYVYTLSGKSYKSYPHTKSIEDIKSSVCK